MWTAVSVAVVLVLLLPYYLNESRIGLRRLLTLKQEILIVFAHPDDEVMFFLPLISLAKKVGVKVRMLCLTIGDYDGLGSIRRDEFKRVSELLGVASADILNDSQMPDGPNKWDKIYVAKSVSEYLGKHREICAIFTFDDYGVSGHPNHISVREGVGRMVRNIADSKAISAYSLSSVPIYRKYIPLLDFIYTALSTDSDSLLAVNAANPLQCLKLMREYKSQDVWFRKLFSVFSRYSYLNEFNQIRN